MLLMSALSSCAVALFTYSLPVLLLLLLWLLRLLPLVLVLLLLAVLLILVLYVSATAGRWRSVEPKARVEENHHTWPYIKPDQGGCMTSGSTRYYLLLPTATVRFDAHATTRQCSRREE
jgi:hypothetical protein